MKNDITRDTFDRTKHFSRVLMQQGRVQLDADWNEQVGILLNYLRTLTTDLIGPDAGPEGACGFELIVEQKRLNDLSNDLDKIERERAAKILEDERMVVSPGRYYVAGLLAENDGFVSLVRQGIGAAPVKKDIGEESSADVSKAPDQSALVYLDVWERHITFIEDDDIREKALAGPDTATRAKVEWLVKPRALDDAERKALDGKSLANFAEVRAALEPLFEEWGRRRWKSRGLLQAGINQHPESDDPCVSSPESVYRGLENQLYRVEIHRSGAGRNAEDKPTSDVRPATFKWARDNGSVVAAWVGGEAEVVKVTAARDQARGFARGQWIELSENRHDILGLPGTLVQLKEAEPGSLTIEPPATNEPFAREFFPNTPKVRRWDQVETEEISLDGGAIPIQYDKWFELEDGVQVRFPKPESAKDGYQFRSGDYWLIPARVATRDIEWPRESRGEGEKDTGTAAPEPAALPPHGVKHYYALLGLLSAAGKAFQFTDLRRKFGFVWA